MRRCSITRALRNTRGLITSTTFTAITASALVLQFLAVLQRLLAEQPRRRARQQVRTQRQAQQQARGRVHRRENRRLPTPRQGEEHTRVRPQPRAQRRPGHVKQLLQTFPVEPVLHHPKNERRVRNKKRRRRRVIAAKPERDLKVSELRQRRALLVKRQLGHSAANEEESAEPLRRRRNQTDNNNRGRCLAISRHNSEIARQHRKLSGFFVVKSDATSLVGLRRRLYLRAGILRRTAKPLRRPKLFRIQTKTRCACLYGRRCNPEAKTPARRPARE